MTRLGIPPIVLGLVILLVAGCTGARATLPLAISNATATDAWVEVSAYAADEEEQAAFAVRLLAPAFATGADQLRETDFVTKHGSYLVRAQLENGTMAERDIQFSRTGGPDLIQVRVAVEGVTIDVYTV